LIPGTLSHSLSLLSDFHPSPPQEAAARAARAASDRAPRPTGARGGAGERAAALGSARAAPGGWLQSARRGGGKEGVSRWVSENSRVGFRSFQTRIERNRI